MENVGQAAREARAAGAQIVIALLHAGDNDDGKTGPVFAAANQLGSAGGVVDAVLGGDSHNIVNTTAANGTPVTIAGYNGKGFIDLQITRQADGTLSFNTLYIANDTAGTISPYGYKALPPTVDPAVSAIVNAAKAEVAPLANQKLGTAAIDLTIAPADSPWGESLAGNWACDVMKAKAKADFAFINNGALRIDIPQGAITIGTLYAFLPFDNTIVTVKMTGAQVKTLLEQAVADGGKGTQAAGLRFVYDPAAPSGSRIVSITKTDGTPVEMTDTATTYKVATNDFMSTGGDGFAVFNTVPTVDTHILFRDALAQNIQEAGHVTAHIEGRIKNVHNVLPEEKVTRADFIGLLVSALGLAADESAAGFSDTLPGQRFAGAVGAAVKAGLVSGYEDGTFRPDNPITREEMAAMAIRAIEAAGFTAEVSDVNTVIAKINDKQKISGWALTSVAATVDAGIIGVKEAGNFAPSGYTTRAEAVEVLDRILSYVG